MPELRKDPIIGRWVIIATERAKRPHDFRTESEEPKGGFCPFCEGNEQKTPPEVFAMRDTGSYKDAPGWRVRVVPNKFPVLRIEGEPEKRAHGMYDRMRGIGAHEVFIETPQHITTMTPLPDDHVAEIMFSYKARLKDLRKDPRLQYGMLFKNVGSAAGASLEHTHSQLIVTPIVPRRVMERLAGAQRFYEFHDRCVYCDIIDQELSVNERLVMETDRFLAVAPYASRFPFETWILPKRHCPRFELATAEELTDLGFLLKRVLRRIETALENPPYNMMLHNLGFNMPDYDHYHWHMEVIPRVTRVAGFEWGTGFYINPVPPEDAASFLRKTNDE
jgi:UDPglucose--hexose-1-phosphate uridylyltransferase